MYIDELIHPEINGVGQYLSIRSEKEGLPLLFYLHGGPGDAALPQMLKYNKELEKYYTVVIWEQRGAGLSYYPFRREEELSIQTFVEDAHTIILYLLQRFGQEKVYLLAHSWGSVIGISFIKQYPELIHTYIGCGQVVNMKKSCRTQYDFLSEKLQDNPKLMKRLKHTDCTLESENWMQDLLFMAKNVIRYKGSIYGKTSNFQYYLDFLFCRKYSWKDLLNRIKGSEQSILFFWQKLMKTDFERETRFGIPVIFMEGRHDYHVSSKLTGNYFDTIETEKQLFWFEHSGHYPQWEEPVIFNKIVASISTTDVIMENTISG